VLETCRELEQIYTKKKELCVKLVIYKICASVFIYNSTKLEMGKNKKRHA